MPIFLLLKESVAERVCCGRVGGGLPERFGAPACPLVVRRAHFNAFPCPFAVFLLLRAHFGGSACPFGGRRAQICGFLFPTVRCRHPRGTPGPSSVPVVRQAGTFLFDFVPQSEMQAPPGHARTLQCARCAAG